jgi:hypothetical protein
MVLMPCNLNKTAILHDGQPQETQRMTTVLERIADESKASLKLIVIVI